MKRHWFNVATVVLGICAPGATALAVGFHGGGGFGGFHGGFGGGFGHDFGADRIGGLGGFSDFGGAGHSTDTLGNFHVSSPRTYGEYGNFRSLGYRSLEGYHPSSFGTYGYGGAMSYRPQAPMSSVGFRDVGGGGIDHAGIPSFSGYGAHTSFDAALDKEFHFDAGLSNYGAGNPASGIGGRLNANQINNFLGIRSGQLPSANLGAGGADTRWDAGYAGNKASWQNLSPAALSGIHQRMASPVRPGAANTGRAQNWLQQHPERAQQWQNWANQVRNQPATGVRPGSNAFSEYHPRAATAIRNHPNAGKIPGSDWWSKYHPEFANQVRDRFDHTRPGSDWWSKYHPNLDHWYYHHDWRRHDWRYWWSGSSWDDVDAWLTAWGIAGAPMYYDYGDGGNIIYQGGNVYVDGTNVGTDEQYAQSASDLATVPPATSDQLDSSTQQQNQWLPLGTFAIVTSQQDKDPSRILQLAVDRQGIVSGTLLNNLTNKSYVVQGRVNKQTQRVAMTFGDKADVVMETGLYNLTQPQTPALVHVGPKKTETFLLVRLDAPPSGSSSAAGANAAVAPASN